MVYAPLVQNATVTLADTAVGDEKSWSRKHPSLAISCAITGEMTELVTSITTAATKTGVGRVCVPVVSAIADTISGTIMWSTSSWRSAKKTTAACFADPDACGDSSRNMNPTLSPTNTAATTT